MKIKSLLIGSAAALVAVSGARAADAVMAPEPEPVEYVRVCDAYGAGFFYIPGTETCLQISGELYYQIGTGSDDRSTSTRVGSALWYSNNTTTVFAGQGREDGWLKQVRARLGFDARSETEWGTLRSFIQLEGNETGIAASADPNVALNQGYLQLGGLTMGYTESLWVVASGRGGPLSYGGWQDQHGGAYYQYQQRALMSYTFASNGFQAALSLEDDDYGSSVINDGNSGYMPDVVAGVGYSGSWGGVFAKLGYDESFDGTARPAAAVAIAPALGLARNDGGFGAQLGGQFNMPNMPGSALRVIGYWSDGDHQYGIRGPNARVAAAAGVPGTAFLGSAEWSAQVSYRQVFSPTFNVAAGFQWFNNHYIAGTDVSSGIDSWAAMISAGWQPVQNFTISAEVMYQDVQSFRDYSNPALTVDPDGSWSTQIRFARKF